eukprot:TRINITY_DN25846_c0_g1_i1.p1 TRINITY_DN25846_c0_g1~~TRINITY_DN25846_c0_g1_i1.p1  ORF type:complete len:167 (-),score=26.27 TRINITY_DN25846_c0_g1_i1:55-555(-)
MTLWALILLSLNVSVLATAPSAECQEPAACKRNLPRFTPFLLQIRSNMSTNSVLEHRSQAKPPALDEDALLVLAVAGALLILAIGTLLFCCCTGGAANQNAANPSQVVYSGHSGYIRGPGHDEPAPWPLEEWQVGKAPAPQREETGQPGQTLLAGRRQLRQACSAC